MALLKKFLLLLWKNYILQKRHNIQTIVEIVVPIAFSAILVIIRFIVSSEVIDQPTLYPPFGTNYLFTNETGLLTKSLKFGSEIWYSPNTTITRNILIRAQSKYFNREDPCETDVDCNYERKNLTLNLRPFKNEQELLQEYTDNYASGGIWAGVIFPDTFGVGETEAIAGLPEIEYKLRFPATQNRDDPDDVWTTEFIYPIFQVLGPRKSDEPFGGLPNYYSTGFAYLQNAIDESIIYNFVKNDTNDFDGHEEKVNTLLSRFPYPEYIDDIFLVALQGWLPFILMLSFIYPVINITKNIVHEKEKRLKESMKMMGLPNYLHWTAWFLKSFLFLLISCILMVIILKIKFFEGGRLAVLTYGHWSVIFIFILIFVISIICLSFFISTLFSTANSASTAAGVIYFMSYMPYFFLQPRYNELSKGTKMFASILPNTGMAFAGQIISMFEGTASGVQWSTLNTGSSPDDNMTLWDCMLILILDSIILLCLTIYIEGVRPGDFGVPLPWYFPFTKSYWFGDSSTSKSDSPTGQSLHQANLFETEPTNGKIGVKIQGLTKVFGKKRAVDGMSLNMYENQITALLGHNGAGKTTTMSMLTGLFPPSSGTAYVNGFDIRTQIVHVRGSLGLCPQHDILFDELTVEEHLRFFCQMKGMEPAHVQSEITRLINALGLEPKRHAQSQTLSGGMKRKLSVGIALCGGSKVVLLDEPTSGMDPGARRSTWDLLQQEKKNRTVILSTHFMDEADLLGDRIAIMANGKVQCCGSSLFLKKQYGGGYHLIMVKEPYCDVDTIHKILKAALGNDIEIDQNVGAELSFALPDRKSHLFADMFEELEKRKVELGIASYGASITTMEEVFMRVGKIAEEEETADTNGKLNGKKKNVSIEVLQSDNQGSSYKLYQKTAKNTGGALIFQQLKAMFVKKMLYALRNKLLLTFQTIIPIAILIVALTMTQTLPGASDPPALKMDLQEYNVIGQPKTTLACGDYSRNDSFCETYQNLAEEYGEIESTGEKDFITYILEKANQDLPLVNFRYVVGLEAVNDLSVINNREPPPYVSEDVNEALPTLVAFFNNQPFHALPLALNFMSSAILRHFSNSTDAKITLTNHPLPLTLTDEIKNAGGFASTGFQVGLNVSFGMAFLAASFVVFLIKERESRAKHLQFVSGVKFPLFWASSFLFDIINYLVPAIAIIVVLIAFRVEDFNTVSTLGYSFVLLVAYGFSIIPQMYLFSFAFTIPSSGFTRMVLLNLFTGMASIVAITILQIEELDLTHIADALEWVFLLFFPQFSIGNGLVQISTNSQLKRLCPLFFVAGSVCGENTESFCCTKYPYSYLSWHSPGIGRNVFFLVLTGTLSICILFLYEAKILDKIIHRKRSQVSVTPPSQFDDSDTLEDTDVAAENSRIRSTNLTQLTKNENLVLRDLTKLYDNNFLAVDKLCLGVQSGECFGLLGVNGAGKTTTFKMLTGDLPISSGDAFVYSNSVKSEIKKVQKNLGYCPQFDAIIEELTGRETIRLFARLRGIKESEIDRLADSLSANLLFVEHIDKRCGAYSGGNKRKLSTAIALIGNPPLVFLDEPTTGMDPVARRHLWNAITNVRDAGTSIVLTSHSMEECEALCTRLSIMVNGKFRCLGSAQHLKNKFGEGYTLIAQMPVLDSITVMNRKSFELGRRRSSLHSNAQPWEKQLQPLRDYVETSFPGAAIKDVHPGYVHYHIQSNENITWGKMFRKMEKAKAMFRLEAYSVGQTTLEQIFLNFTKAQINDD